MPIMAAQGRSDARVAARILADAAIECLNNPTLGPSHTVTLNNVYRFLEAYRVNTFFGQEQSVSPSNGSEALSLLSPLEQNVGAVRSALTDAIQKAFAGQTKDEALSAVESVLKKLAYPEIGVPPSEAERESASRFFSEMNQQLTA